MAILKRVFREPVNTLTHGLGALGGVLATVVLWQASGGVAWKLAGSVVFGISITGLLASSALYHWVKKQDLIERFRRLDHMMIYVLIAGSYTPFCLAVFEPADAAWILSAVWAVAAAGAGVKFFKVAMPRWFSTALYLLMGWAAVFLIPQVRDLLGWEAVLWIGAGGLCYTVGAVMYALQRPNLIPDWLGFHEIWHVCVLAAGFCHFWAVYRYVVMA